MFGKILIPTDFSKGAEISIKNFVNFVKNNKMEVKEAILLHVVDYDTIDTLINGKQLFYESEKKEAKDIERKLIEESKKKLDSIRQEIKIAREIKIIVKVGIPYEEIVKTAEEENVSLIMLPSHGKLNFLHEIFGSTTMRVLKKTKRPVLLIKALED